MTAFMKKWMCAGFVLLAAATGLLTAVGDGLAMPYRPVAAVSMLSEYAPLTTSAPLKTRFWRVTPEAGPGGATILRFFPETSVQAPALCELRIFTTGEIQWIAAGTAEQKNSGTGLLLAPGFPAPCDVLPVGRAQDGAAYEEKVEAGGRVFLNRYRISVETVSAGEARAKGWIRIEDADGALVMITVTDQKGRRVARQLWPAGGTWWLYEETPLRRSWLIP